MHEDLCHVRHTHLLFHKGAVPQQNAGARSLHAFALLLHEMSALPRQLAYITFAPNQHHFPVKQLEVSMLASCLAPAAWAVFLSCRLLYRNIKLFLHVVRFLQVT